MSGMTHEANRDANTIRVWLYGRGGKPTAEKVAKDLCRIGERTSYVGKTGNCYVFTAAAIVGKAAMSPQAMRRLVRTMTEGELRDLAIDISHALVANEDGDRAAVIFSVLRRGDA